MRITAWNRGPEAAPLDLLPTIWLRNTWRWGRHPASAKLWRGADREGARTIGVEVAEYGRRWLLAEGAPELLFTENETNMKRLFGVGEPGALREGCVSRILDSAAGRTPSIPAQTGTKAAALYRLEIPAGGSTTLRLRLTDQDPERRGAAGPVEWFGKAFDETFAARIAEADEFYAQREPQERVRGPPARAAPGFRGLAVVQAVLPLRRAHLARRRSRLSAASRRSAPTGRNHEWKHLYNADVLSMPDKWEYPWYASWDTAFHCVALALVDPDFAKEQLILLLREWYMHPNGQLPAYEWAFGDVNPPVHAWAAWRVYKIEKRVRGCADRAFLERVFHKLLLNFTWWVNRKDPDGLNVFEGGFLGLDNIGVFDRSAPLPTGGHLEQSDGTSWMGMYCLNMLAIALELSREEPAYEDVASKFFEHFIYIAQAMNDVGTDGIALWDEEDGFYYDALHLPDGAQQFLKMRSMVGLVPLFAVETLEPEMLAKLTGFTARMQWFLDNVPAARRHIDMSQSSAVGVRHLLSLVSRERLLRVLGYMLDQNEFLSPHGIRALSKFHRDHPYIVRFDGTEYRVDYEPAESRSGTFGGNSNWRGPVWFPSNFLLIESLQRFHHYFGDSLQVEYPTGSGRCADALGSGGGALALADANLPAR